jgi:predicted acylesterase/phospholipase RssA
LSRLVRRWIGGRPPADPVAEPGPAARDQGLLASVSARERYEGSRWRRAAIWSYLLRGERPPPIPSYSGLVEAPAAGKVGIACSGGGIRSAAFSLGALQVLQEANVLERSAYLAGVSGGGYMTAAFAMVRRTGHPDDSDPALLDARHPPFFPGSPEEQYLRNRVSYMAPGAAGKLRLTLRVLLGMGINLLFLALALAAVAAPLALLYGQLYPALAQHVGHAGLCAGRTCDFGFGIARGVWIPIAAVAAAGLLLGGASMLAYGWPVFAGDAAMAWALRLLRLAALGAVVLIALPLLAQWVRGWGAARSAVGIDTASGAGVGVVGTGGAATFVGALLLYLRGQFAEAKRTVEKLAGTVRWYRNLGARVRLTLAYLLAGVVGPALAALFVSGVISAVLNRPDAGDRLTIAAVCLAAFGAVYFEVDLTSWSLHPFYRRRLQSAFALKRVARTATDPPISGNEAGIAAERDCRVPVLLSSLEPATGADAAPAWPTLLVCAAANISDDAATPPGRAVTSFTFSAGAMGGPLIGAVPTAALEAACDDRRKLDFTLPAAVAMSGAALAPSMGKTTRRPLTFLLALANVRLGVWVPNPRRLHSFDGRTAVTARRPRPWYLLCELLGRNRINAPYVYVTDGGHYDNLGIVELVRRGCTEIYCFDASNDNFDALGDAVALVRGELDVDIDIDRSALVPDASGFAARNCVTATIRYPGAGAPAARLHYARTVMTAGSPADVLAYHQRDPRFPHDPTVDQLYKDERFEAYRALGARAARSALDAA